MLYLRMYLFLYFIGVFVFEKYYLCICVLVYLYICIFMHLYLCIYVCIFIFVYLCFCICVYVFGAFLIRITKSFTAYNCKSLS